jgi:histone H3/H4
MSTWFDRLLGRKEEPKSEPNVEVEEVTLNEFIDDDAFKILEDALAAERVLLIEKAMKIAQLDNREKINFGDMKTALEDSGFKVESLDNN